MDHMRQFVNEKWLKLVHYDMIKFELNKFIKKQLTVEKYLNKSLTVLKDGEVSCTEDESLMESSYDTTDMLLLESNKDHGKTTAWRW